MFNVFNNKSKIKEKDFEFLKAIINKLPSKYLYLIDQVSKEFILGKKINKLGENGTYTLTLNANLEHQYSNKLLPKFFIIRNINIWNKRHYRYEKVELHIMEGMLAGFKIDTGYTSLDFGKIDVAKVTETHFNNENKGKVEEILGDISKEMSSFLDIEGTFKIEIPEGEFYVIKDLEDGNYLSMDNKGAVYGMIHDPYEVEKLFDNKEAFFEALKSGKFSISEYYDKKMS